MLTRRIKKSNFWPISSLKTQILINIDLILTSKLENVDL